LDVLRTEVDDVLVAGDVVLVVGRLRFRGKGSGVETEASAGYVARLSGGKLAYMRAFREPEQALLAMGLTE
jgi:hypothetical protein